MSKREEGNFKHAEQAKLKIRQLKEDLRNLGQLFTTARNKENQKEAERQCESELQNFRREWDNRLKEQIEHAKAAESKLSAQQQA